MTYLRKTIFFLHNNFFAFLCQFRPKPTTQKFIILFGITLIRARVCLKLDVEQKVSNYQKDSDGTFLTNESTRNLLHLLLGNSVKMFQNIGQII